MNISWNSEGYKEGFSFVPAYGQDVLSLIRKKGGRALDLGCGNGALTAKLSEMGFDVMGLDASDDMIALARKDYPELEFLSGDACTFSLDEKADLVFSNAVLHWIDPENQDAMLSNVYANLRDGGEFVFEMGGKGCAEAVHSALECLFARRNRKYRRLQYFPSIGEYSSRLEKAGFKVDYAILFDRPTAQKGDDGLASWIRMFNLPAFDGMEEEEKEEILKEAESLLRPKLFRDNRWIIDYVRLRCRAVK